MQMFSPTPERTLQTFMRFLHGRLNGACCLIINLFLRADDLQRFMYFLDLLIYPCRYPCERLKLLGAIRSASVRKLMMCWLEAFAKSSSFEDNSRDSEVRANLSE